MARGRKSRGKKLRKVMLFFCEGDTEKIYIDLLKSKYRLSNVQTKVYVGKGQSKELVEYAKKHIENLPKNKLKNIERVFIVFDKDYEDISAIDTAYNLAKEYEFEICYSNVSFELWLLAHYKKINRTKKWTIPELEKELTEILEVDDYTKHKANKITIKKIFSNLDDIKNNLNELSTDRNKANYTNMYELIHEVFIKKI